MSVSLAATENSIRKTIKHYKKRAQEIEFYLTVKPKEWGKISG